MLSPCVRVANLLLNEPTLHAEHAQATEHKASETKTGLSAVARCCHLMFSSWPAWPCRTEPASLAAQATPIPGHQRALWVCRLHHAAGCSTEVHQLVLGQHLQSARVLIAMPAHLLLPLTVQNQGGLLTKASKVSAPSSAAASSMDTCPASTDLQPSTESRMLTQALWVCACTLQDPLQWPDTCFERTYNVWPGCTVTTCAGG